MHYLEQNELHHIAGGMSLGDAMKLALELSNGSDMSREEAMRLARQIEKATDAGLPWMISKGEDKWIFT